MRKMGIILFISFCLLSSLYLVITALQVNSGEERLKKEEEKLAFLKKENEELLEEIEYRKTDEFVINEARKTLNYGFEGEEIIVIPKERETGSLKSEASEETGENLEYGNEIKEEVKESKYLSNLNLWIKVFG
ncbi:septum formation initiator family protein, partial [Patescibacteria group bacterium]|nr:septum formation initiator family protein [Patescibacteria group bacterium]